MCTLAEEKTVLPEHINEYSATNIIRSFTDWRIRNTDRFRYARSTQPVTETALTYKDGIIEMINRELSALCLAKHSLKYLYDKIAFDSPLEKDNIMMTGTGIDEVVVYGKIPKSVLPFYNCRRN